ncbi:hypothetical protein [Phytoactinopolyspora halotolerans]|uniref:Uncharacterized protein n=1 Tax=Phytoactinopolyspora halotolerans TaxID=1981512 RepID=A0A6L9S9C2_9ACTN|nr:hypothetical protein [Phytoactinopolyspora halotolerans]NEE01108.1 hypothetical protein [Phytoactinopolyspora halotolerans]
MQELDRLFQSREASLESARRVWEGSGEFESVEAFIWPEGSLGDRFFSDFMMKEVERTPLLHSARLPGAGVIAAEPAQWSVATWALVRGVVFDGLSLEDRRVQALLDALAPVVTAELTLDGVRLPGLVRSNADVPEPSDDDGPLFVLGVMALVDATWAVVGDDSLQDVVDVLSPVLDDVHPDVSGRTIAEALVGAFAHHYRCEMPGDDELLQRVDVETGNALQHLVTTNTVAVNDVLRVGLAALAAIAELCRSESASVLPQHS